MLVIFLFASIPVVGIVYLKNVPSFIASMIFFIYFPFVIPLAFVGAKMSQDELLLWSSSLHLTIVSFFLLGIGIDSYLNKKKGFIKKNKIHLVNFMISFTVFIVVFPNVYIENYLNEWKDNSVAHPKHILQKSENNVSIHVQNEVRKIINKALVPKYTKPEKTLLSVLEHQWKKIKKETWNEVNIKDLEIEKPQFIALRKLLMKMPSLRYNYNVSSNQKYALVVLSSKDKEQFRIIFRFTFSDKWHLKEMLTYHDYNVTKRHLLGDTKATRLKSIYYNIPLTDFYLNEFNQSIQAFIEAKDIAKVFKSRVEYRFALTCIEDFNSRLYTLRL